jgi:hypothetical protein
MRGFAPITSLVLFVSMACLSCGSDKGKHDDGDAASDTPVDDLEDGGDDPAQEDVEEETLPCLDDADCVDQDPCNGEETCDPVLGLCRGGSPLPDGTVCSVDPRMICLAGLCRESACGDGFFDPGGGEFCEPPNEGDCDPDCLLVCGSDVDCLDDGEPCNGHEYCNLDTSRCSRRDPLPDGTLCQEEPRRICLASVCMESLCGDGCLGRRVLRAAGRRSVRQRLHASLQRRSGLRG